MSAARSTQFPFASLHQPNYAWWRPLLEIVTALVATVALAAATASIMNAVGADPGSDEYEEIFLFLTVAVEVRAVWIAVRLAGRRPLRSVVAAGELPSLLKVLGAYLLALVVTFAVVGAISVYGYGSSWDKSLATPPSRGLLVFILLAALGEEMTFRGLFFQAFTAWTKHPVIGACVAILLFVAVHLPHSLAPVVHYIIDGAIYTFLAWYFNNVFFAFAAHAAWNTVAESQDYGVTGDAASLLTTAPASLATALVLLLVFRGSATRATRTARTTQPQDRTPARA